MLAALTWLGPPAAAAETGLLRVAHLSPDSPAVDVTISGPGPLITLTDVAYGDVSDYRELPAGTYAVSVRGAGTDPASPPALSTAVEVRPGTARTVAGVGLFADLSLTVLDDDLALPAAGSAHVRVLAAAAGAPSVDVAVAGAPPLASELAFGAAGGYVDVPAGSIQLQVSPAGGAGTSVPLTPEAGSVYSLLVLDGDDGALTARLVRDAAGPAAVPMGGVDAGLVGPVARPGAFTGLLSRLVAVADAVADDAPTRLRVPAIAVDASLQAIRPGPTGALAAPAEPAQAGWLATGPAPGDVGPAVVTGHVAHHGPAVFTRLAGLAPGDEVLVDRGDGTTARFEVTRVARYAKTDFPTAEVYGPTPDAQLRLITCGGALDATEHTFADNVVVYARGT